MAVENPAPVEAAASEPDLSKKRRQRNLAIGALILVFVVVVYAVTILRIGGNIAHRPF